MNTLKNEKWTEDRFLQVRQEVLQMWDSGKEVNLEEAIEYHHSRPGDKYTSYHLHQAKKEGRTLIGCRGGVATVEGHIDLLQFLEKGGIDLLPLTVDSYTRNLRFEKAAEGIQESYKKGKSILNGFPAVNHGVDACRKIDQAVNLPITTKHGSADGRLLGEITFAGGMTDFNGGGICFNLVYSKDIPLEKSLLDWQYADYLIGYYTDQGIPLHREESGALTGTLMPPCISISVAIIEALLAAEQGVKHMCISYGQGGNVLQDIAAIQMLTELGEEYLEKFGYDMVLTSKFDQWMGAFPTDEDKAFGLIALGAATAALGGATQVVVKSPHEAAGIPTKEANAAGIKASKQVIGMLEQQKFPDNKPLNEEKEIIREEVISILEKVMELGDGDLAVGTVNAFEAGVLDIPFAPSSNNADKVMPIRDHEGAIRFLDTGNLPFSQRLKKFHEDKISQRKGGSSYNKLMDDIFAVSRGYLIAG